MRRLHAVGKHEKFVASGLYAYQENGVTIGLQEHWSIHEVGGGAQFIRVDIDGRNYDGHSTLIEALRSPEGWFERIDQQIFEQINTKPFKLSHTFFDEHIELVVRHDGRRIEETIPMPTPYGLFLHSQLLAGFTLKHALRHSDKVMLLHIIVQDGSLSWLRFETVVTALKSAMIRVDGRELSSYCYEWQDEVTACIDQFDVTLHAENLTGQVLLTQYARRPEPKPA